MYIRIIIFLFFITNLSPNHLSFRSCFVCGRKKL